MPHPFQLLLLQIAIILILARLAGLLLKLARQPQVIGEMLAGLLLGPSLLGRIHHGSLLSSLFPPASRLPLDLISQVGVVLFMFLVGLELDLARVLQQRSSLLRIAAASMLIPFLAGIPLALCLQHAGFANSPHGSPLSFILFISTALSITAFPVLARILKDAGQSHSPIALIAIPCAALNDIVGWCLFAVVLSLFHTTKSPSLRDLLYPFVGVLLYTSIMLFLVRPFLRQFQSRFESQGKFSPELLATFFILLTLSSLATDYIGIHALFGAFMLGAIMPAEPRLVHHLTNKLESFATLFLLPLYFAYTGLHTDIGLLNSPSAWTMAALVTAVAILSKVAGTYAAARSTHLPPRLSLTLGILLNTRGLMELVILNIALEAQAISPQLFSTFVLMTLFTTIMTTPLMYALLPLSHFIHRTLTFTHQFRDGKFPPRNAITNADQQCLQSILEQFTRTTKCLEAFEFKAALASIIALARVGNQYFDLKQPWLQRRSDPTGCDTTLNICLQLAKSLTTMIQPFLPFAATNAARILGLNIADLSWDAALNELPAGHPLGEPVLLFRKLDPDADHSALNAAISPHPQSSPPTTPSPPP